MSRKLPLALFFLGYSAALGFAQNQDATTKAVRGQIKQTTTENKQEQQPAVTTTRPATPAKAPAAKRVTANASEPGAQGVLAAFDALVDGIRRADVDAVTSLYWDSPQLTIFNNNGTITRSWGQMRSNRAASYPEIKNVTLEIRNRNVHLMGREGAVVTCQWTQTQTFRGEQSSASGRLTVIFRRIGPAWKIIHTHTSPDAPDPSRLLPSEQTPDKTSVPNSTPTAAKPAFQNKP
jgi:ketosteroid isomerase-like protein